MSTNKHGIGGLPHATQLHVCEREREERGERRERERDSLGCKVGTCCPSLSSLSMCSSVVFPALSRPRNTNLPDFLYRPEAKPEEFKERRPDVSY